MSYRIFGCDFDLELIPDDGKRKVVKKEEPVVEKTTFIETIKVGDDVYRFSCHGWSSISPPGKITSIDSQTKEISVHFQFDQYQGLKLVTIKYTEKFDERGYDKSGMKYILKATNDMHVQWQKQYLGS